MAKSAVNYTGLIPETGDSFESATQNTTGSFDGIDAKIGIIDDNITNIDDEIGIIDTSLSGHISNTSNPHSVTKSQIGLGNVDNTSDLIKMTVSTFSDLDTTDKTIIGAINETIVTESATNGNINVGGVKTTVYTHPNHSGDVTSTGDGITIIQSNVVGNSKLAQMPAMTIKGNNTAKTADPKDLTKAEMQTFIQDTNNRMVSDAQINQWDGTITGVNTGDIIYRTSNNVPTGYLKANGATISRTTYANLFALIGTTFGAGDGSTTFKLPDLRSEFIRGWDDARGVDVGRTFGSYQADAFQGHHHTQYHRADSNFADGTASRGQINSLAATSASGSGYTREAISDGTNGTPRTAAETRPRNIALMAIIKY